MISARRVWLAALDLLVLAPLAVAALSPVTRGAGLGVNASAGLGLLGTTALAAVVLLVSRVRGLTRTLGLDALAALHRWAGAAAVILLLAHTVLAVAVDPRGVALLDVTGTTGSARAAVVSLVALLLVTVLVVPVVGTGRYAVRARLHAVLAAVALGAGAAHVVLLRRLVADPVVAASLAVPALLLVAVLARRWVLRPLLGRGAHVVTGVRTESPSTSTVVLVPTHMRRALRFEPGQFVWLRLHQDVVFTAEHPFTIADGDHAGQVEVTVRHDGDFSALLGQLDAGRRVWLDGPHGGFVPSVSPAGAGAPRTGVTTLAPDADGADGLVLIAGGVGITPIMSMLRSLVRAGDARPHRLMVAQRPGEELFDEELDVLTRRLRLDVVRLDRRLDVEVLAGFLPAGARTRYDYYLCGPGSLLDDGVGALLDCGVPQERIHTESFG